MTNDDGITAPGLNAMGLLELSDVEQLEVIAPDSNRSAMAAR